MKLTAVGIDRIKATDKRQEIPDALCVGLYLVVQPTGKKGWQVRYRHGGTHRRMTLAPYPVLSLADARARAREVMAQIAEGRDPAAEVRAAKAPPEEGDRDKVRALVAQFDKRHLSGLRSGREVRRQLDYYVIPAWGDRDIASITRRDILDLLDSIVDAGKPTTANRLKAHIAKFLGWCADRDIIPASPAANIKAPAKETARARFLTDDELRWFWAACDRMGYPFGMMGKLLLLTGQREAEVCGMTRGEINGDVWHLSADRTKNKRPHDVPLSGPVLALLGASPWGEGYILSTTGRTHVSGLSKAQGRLADLMREAAQAERGEVVEIPHWTFHDLRRTLATGMARIGIPVRITEAVVNHVSGTGGGIVAVYQRHDYADEKREALDAWSAHVMQVVGYP